MDNLDKLIRRAKRLYDAYIAKEALVNGELDILLLAAEVLRYAESMTGIDYMSEEAEK